MIIETTEQLTCLCEKFSQADYITLDTEFIREKTYYPVLCLIQIASETEMACIDPLSNEIDLHPLFELLQNKNVVKVFHAARQDVEIFYHLSGQIPTPLFDTQLAAMVCGYGESIGYQKLVQDITGVSLDKSMRFTDWSHRPLNEQQIEYALHDVTYLRDIYRHLKQKIQQTNRMSWLDEEIMIQNNPETYETNDDTVWKKIKTPFKKQSQVHLFSRICAWREKTAKEKNKPRRHILKDDALIELAVTAPQSTASLNELRNIPNGFANSHLGKELLDIIHQALSDPKTAWPQDWKAPKPLTATQHVLMDLLKLLLSVVATDIQVAPKIIASNDELAQFVSHKNEVPFMKGWRKEVFGNKALLFQQGLLSFRYNPKTKKPEILEQDLHDSNTSV